MGRFKRFYEGFKFGDQLWDPSHRYETSWILSPWALCGIRAAIAGYAFLVLLFSIGWEYTWPAYGGVYRVRLSFSYFTVLCYWGLAWYFLVAALHTFSYALHGGTPLLNRFPRPLQALHGLFHSSITTYPFLVSIVYWTVLYSGPWFPRRFDAWSNISQHALNSLFAGFEILMTRPNPAPWVHLFWLTLILGLYCGLAYLTHYTKGVYAYDFLDPDHGHQGRTVGYVFGIALANILIFCLARGLTRLRKWLTETKWDMKGRFFARRAMGQGEVDLEGPALWEK